MKNELNNLLKQCANPVFCVWTTLFFMRRALFSLQYRYLPSRWYYPKAVREAFSKLPTLPEGGRGGVGEYTKNPSSPPLQKGRKSLLKIATGFLEYDGEPDWRKRFDDPEVAMSLHRWGWLIYDGMDKEHGLALIRSWLNAMGPVPKGIAGTPYTVSERLVNALLFFAPHSPSPQLFPALTPTLSPRERGIEAESGGLRTSPLPAGEGQGEGIPGDLRSGLLQMAFHVARNIEYHGVRATGNHVVNNARALFFAGQVLGVKELSNLSLAIIQDALPWLVTKDGFLREESSHYHLLFTRWIMEIHELAKNTGHKEMENYLEPWIKKLVKQCWFFLVGDSTSPLPPPLTPPRAGGETSSGRRGKWQIPLIGDVSPDCTPEWLVEYLMPHLEQYTPSPQPSSALTPTLSQRESGIEAESGGLRTSPLPAGEGRVRGGQAFPESGWFRLDHGSTTIFWHVPQSSMVHRATHGHADLCSLVLFHKGRPILIDPGRPAYHKDEGCLARDHNTLTVDGLDPFLYDRAQKFPAFYQRRNVQVDWQEDGKDFIFTVLHTGFQRIQGDRIDHTRRFRVGHEFLEVEDELRGRRSHSVETFFHFAPGVDKIDVQNSAGERRVVVGFTSYAYGVKINSPVIVVSHRDQSPFSINYKIKL